ncbi:hypothetical protein [Marasmitruncus massiliensis]|uniref:hypothetical protein n=1 Tax=Marasmitruncus massiliensis TaxID=1944642 RepID=UPI000C7B2ED0|nr:hypothetical protein [Marasmitruncus massiliensis]
MKPIYQPAGRAREYGDYAINIYTGCPHRCYYCFAPNVLHKTREEFHCHVEPRKGIVDAVKRQLKTEQITDKLIHLCFTCDPYPVGYDTMPTREIIKAIKGSGNHVQILTKGDGSRDFDLLDSNDWYGVTYAGYDAGDLLKPPIPEPGATAWICRLADLQNASEYGIKTWVSCEPVLVPEAIYSLIERNDEIDLFKIGKLNYHPSNINWHDFGIEAERLCQQYKRKYYIKEDLRAEMELQKESDQNE